MENVLSFGRRLVFLGKNRVFLEGNVFFGVAVWYFWEKMQSTGEKSGTWGESLRCLAEKCHLEQLKVVCFGEHVSSSEDKCNFWETLPSLVGKGPTLERMLAFLGEKSIYV